MPKRFDDRDDGDDGLGSASRLVAVADHLDAGEGAHAVVHSHHALGIVRHFGKSILHGVEACLSAVGQGICHIEMIFLAELVPIVLLGLGQYQDDLQIGIVLPESLQRPHQHRLPADGQELFGNVAPHPQALSPCHNYCIVHIFSFCIGLYGLTRTFC